MKRFRRLALAAALGTSILAGDSVPARAATKRKPATKAPDKAKDKARGKPTGKTKPAASAKDAAPEAPVPGAKVAVFPFTGDDAESIHRQVLHVLRSKGLKPNISLKPMFDSPEQYRETAATLGLVAFVDGEVAADGGEASATIYLRSGANGLRLWSATFTGERRQLANDVGKRLWDGWSEALGRACADAVKPRKTDREPMRINAGTPISPGDGE